MPETSFLGMTYPGESEDPFFTSFQTLVEQLDSNLYALVASAGPLLGGGQISVQTTSVSPFQAILRWSAPFEIVIPGSGLFMQIPFGPDGETAQVIMNDGDRVYVNVPNLSSTDTPVGQINVINGAVVNATVVLPGLLTVGIYRGGVFHNTLPARLNSETTGDRRSAVVSVPEGASQLAVTFSVPLADPNYALNVNLNNSVDAFPQFQQVNVIDRSVNGFTAVWPAPTDSPNYTLEYTAASLI